MHLSVSSIPSKLLAFTFLLFSAGNVLAVPCSVATAYAFDSNAHASQACNADLASAPCETWENDTCSYNNGTYYFFTRNIYLSWTMHRYDIVTCANGEAVDRDTGECIADEKNRGCQNNCGPGASPAVGK